MMRPQDSGRQTTIQPEPPGSPPVLSPEPYGSAIIVSNRSRGAEVLQRFLRQSDWPSYVMLGVLVVLGLIFNLLTQGSFLTPRNLSLLLRQGAILAVVAAGVSTLMVMGEIDLSIGSAVYLTSIVAAQINVTLGLSTVFAVVAALGAGAVLGVWQGFWISRLGVASFIVTLAGLLAFRGLGYAWTNAGTIAPVSDSFISVSEGFIPVAWSFVLLAAVYVVYVLLLARRFRLRQKLGVGQQRPTILVVQALLAALPFALFAWIAGNYQGIPMAVLFMAITVIILNFTMARTTFGRNLYVIGSNREAARLAGINVRRYIFIGFVVMGVLYGIGGVLTTARLGGMTPQIGNFLELNAIAAAVLGGTSLSGGVGTVWGAVVGAFLLSGIDNGLSIMSVNEFWQEMIKGFILLAAVWFDASTRRHTRG